MIRMNRLCETIGLVVLLSASSRAQSQRPPDALERYLAGAGNLQAGCAESELSIRIDLVKSPSIFIRNMRFVLDYRSYNRCSEPVRLLVTAGEEIQEPK
jgi:hypothetical protein